MYLSIVHSVICLKKHALFPPRKYFEKVGMDKIQAIFKEFLCIRLLGYVNRLNPSFHYKY